MSVASVGAAVIISVDSTRRLRVSFLDRLKREAEQQRLQAEAVARERDERDSRYKSEIEPQMKALTAYLEGLAATMLEVRPPISIPMAIQGYGEITLVPFWDYKVEHDRRQRSFALSMAWSMRIDAERAPAVRADGVTRVKALTSIFRQYHLGGIKEEKRTPQGDLSCATFQARGLIKSRMEAQISADDPVLRLTFENASWLGSSRRQVPWEQINDSLFDRIARFIVREDDSLFTEELPDALRQRLRKDQEPTGRAAVQAPAPAPSDRVREATPAVAPPPVPAIAPVAPAVEPVVAAFPPESTGGFGQGMLAAPAPITEGEVIEIDESKLGLSDFHEEETTGSAFSFGSIERRASPGTSPAPTDWPPASTAPLPQSTAQPAPAAPTHAERRDTAGAAPPVPTPAAPVAAAANAPTNPHAAAAAHAAVLAQRAAAARAAAAQAAANSATSSAATAPAASAAALSATPTANAGDTPSAAADGETPDPAKEREAALFRLRMRAMMARLRTDESDKPKT